MINRTQIEALVEDLYAALPVSLQNIKQEVQQQFKDVLQAGFARMNLVTREEFDVQIKILARTREKVDVLAGAIESYTTKRK